jgi:hypothetical protein
MLPPKNRHRHSCTATYFNYYILYAPHKRATRNQLKLIQLQSNLSRNLRSQKSLVKSVHKNTMGTDLPYAAEAEMTLSPDELEVCPLSSHRGMSGN